MTQTFTIKQDGYVIASIEIDIYGNYSDIEWNSDTGVVTAKIDGAPTAIPYKGNARAQLLPGLPVKLSEGITEIKYHYWYY